MKYAFFLDIDGTLTWGSDIPQKTIDAIKRARKEGHLVFINTGRSLDFIPKWIFDKVEFDGIVAGLGCYCSIGDRVIKADAIPCDMLMKIFDYLVSKNKRFMFEGENEVLVYKNSSHFPVINYANEFLTRYNYVKVEKIYVGGVLEKDEFDTLADMFFTLQHGDYAECGIKGCDKAKGMKLIMDELPADYKCVAMGDSVNDLQMLEASDIAVAMGNAPDNVKNLCHIISTHASLGGVGHAFELILNES